MAMFSWLTRNWADTDEGDPKPLDLSLSLADAMAMVQAAIVSLPRWQVESVDDVAHTIHATRRTRMMRYVDDISLRLEALTEQQTRLHARSQSRVGKGDLGQNRRNLRELWRALKKMSAY